MSGEDGPPTADSRADGGAPAGYGWTPGWLRAARSRPRLHRGLLVLAVVVGLAAAWIHWLGLFAAGALVGLVSRTVPRAVGAGLLVGVAILAVHVIAAPAMSPGEFVGFAPLSYLAIAAGLVAPVWGSLVRAVV